MGETGTINKEDNGLLSTPRMKFDFSEERVAEKPRKILKANCCRCHRVIEESEMKQYGYMACM